MSAYTESVGEASFFQRTGRLVLIKGILTMSSLHMIVVVVLLVGDQKGCAGNEVFLAPTVHGEISG